MFIVDVIGALLVGIVFCVYLQCPCRINNVKLKTFYVCAGIFLIGLCLVKMFGERSYNNSNVEQVGMYLSVVVAMLGFNLGGWWILEKIFKGEYAT